MRSSGDGVTRRRWLGWLAWVFPAGWIGCGGETDETYSSYEPGSAEDAARPDGGAETGADAPAEAATDAAKDVATNCEPTGGDALGPFHEPGAPFRTTIAGAEEPGDRIRIDGIVVGSDCQTPVAGAILDIWHADATGVYHGATEQYRLRGQVRTDADGRFSFDTILPGNYDNRPRHIHFIVSSPGLEPLTTQLYFADDPLLGANDSCQPPTCDSSDADRTTELVDEDGVGVGFFEVRMAAS